VKVRGLIPLAVFVVMAAFLAVGLKLDPREVPSPLIDKPAPAFTLPRLDAPDKTLSPADLKGQVWLFNVWASWCVSCRQEHPLLVELSRTGEVPIYGLDYKDDIGAAHDWLDRMGNPYLASVVDADGRVGIDYGVYGVPETYLIDKEGTIRYKQIGPLTPAVIEKKILPMVRELNG
jgi:cytochrome c biogenesis protein CcmG, thiol:disulfide interchange protein DsbE